MAYLFINYPKCSTCKKARKWLDEKGIEYDDRHIVEDRPTANEIEQWVSASGLKTRRFFNTSGMKYRELGLKDKLDGMTDAEQIELLASDGMLVKRPVLVGENIVLIGFVPSQWEKELSGKS